MIEKSPFYFDIDKTLINTTQLVKLLIQEVAYATGKPVENIRQLFAEYSKTLQDTTDFVHLDCIEFFVEHGFDRESLEAAFNKDAIYQKSVYTDAMLFLSLLKESTRELGIFSQASEPWQIFKLEKSGLAEKIIERSNWIIVPRKMQSQEIARLPRGAVLFDDKLEVLEAVRAQRADIRCIWVNRAGVHAAAGEDLDQIDRFSPELLEQLEDVGTEG
ncbi:MAG: hypothetical protein WDZ94_01460 [Patescibacteria group bacterium]